VAPDGEDIERADAASGLAALAQVFAELSGAFVFGGFSVGGLQALILTESRHAADELGDNLASFLICF